MWVRSPPNWQCTHAHVHACSSSPTTLPFHRLVTGSLMLTLLKTTAATQMARIPPTASQRIRSPSLSHAMCAVRWTRITHSTHSTQSTQTQAQAHKTNNKHSNLRLFGLLLSPLTASLVPTTTTAAPSHAEVERVELREVSLEFRLVGVFQAHGHLYPRARAMRPLALV